MRLFWYSLFFCFISASKISLNLSIHLKIQTSNLYMFCVCKFYVLKEMLFMVLLSYFRCRNATQRRLRVRRNTMLRKSMSQETRTNIDMSRKPSLVRFIVHLCPPIEMPVVVQYIEEPILCSWRIGERSIIWEYMQQRPGRIIFLQILMLLIVGL